MKVKVLFATFLTLLICIGTSNAETSEYTLTFRKQNLWVSQKDITPARDLLAALKQQPLLAVKAVCSDKDTHCKERIDIANLVFKTKKLNQRISQIERSKSLDKNTIKIKVAKLDKNKYDIQFINYKDNENKPVKKSENDIKRILAKSELKYLSQFRFYCQKKDQLCEERFNHINQKIGTTLTFKYNISLSINPKLDKNETALAAYRHDYGFSPKEETEKRASIKVKTKNKPKTFKYTNNPYVIVFNTNSSVLTKKEKRKIVKIVKENPENKLYFTCNRANPELCETRIREIKFHALTATDNIIELYQLEKSAPANYVAIRKNK